MNPFKKTVQLFGRLKEPFFGFLESVKTAKAGFRNGLEQTELDKKLVFSLAKSRWPNWRQLKYLKKYLSRGERLAVGSCLLVILLSSLFLGFRFYKTHLQIIPVAGGDYVEGVVGAVKYINPLYSSVSDLDNDIVRLVYSALFKRDAAAKLVNDLASGYEVGPDGKAYVIKIKTNAVWHSGGAVTADDVVFTFQAIKNIDYKSPLYASFTGVEIEKVDEQTVKFVLAEPYAAFLDLLTFGILPAELWSQIEPTAASLAELNLKPVGSGEYKFKSLVKDKAGNLRAYNLTRNNNYYGQPPYINTVSFKLFGSAQEAIAALNNNLIKGIGYLPAGNKNQLVAQDSLNLYNLTLPKISAVFFNAKANSALGDKKVRQALAYAIDKNKIIDEVLAGNGRAIDGPILPESFAYNAAVKKYNYDVVTSTSLLMSAGWKIVELKEEDIAKAKEDLTAKDQAVKTQAEANLAAGPGKWLMKNNNYLTIELTTVDNPEYSQAAQLIAAGWQAINVKTKINLVPANQIQSEVIRPRNFSALFYSEIAGADPDPYAFWHSSQIGQAGLNIADYANKEVDKLLEEGRLTNDLKLRLEKYKKFQELIVEDEPAIFLYSPNYTYVQSKEIKGFSVTSIILPNDRFADVNQWHINTGEKIVW